MSHLLQNGHVSGERNKKELEEGVIAQAAIGIAWHNAVLTGADEKRAVAPSAHGSLPAAGFLFCLSSVFQFFLPKWIGATPAAVIETDPDSNAARSEHSEHPEYGPGTTISPYSVDCMGCIVYGGADLPCLQDSLSCQSRATVGDRF